MAEIPGSFDYYMVSRMLMIKLEDLYVVDQENHIVGYQENHIGVSRL